VGRTPLWFGVSRRGFGVARLIGRRRWPHYRRGWNKPAPRRAWVGCGTPPPRRTVLLAENRLNEGAGFLQQAIRIAQAPTSKITRIAAPSAISPGCGASKAGAPKPRARRPGLWLVYRRLRYRRPEGGEGATRSVGVRLLIRVVPNDRSPANTSIRPLGREGPFQVEGLNRSAVIGSKTWSSGKQASCLEIEGLRTSPKTGAPQ